MKKILCAVLATAALLCFAGCKKTSAKSDKFVLGLDASFPPMGYTEADGTINGYDIDLAKEVCKRLGKEFVAKPINWDAKEMELSSGSIDCIWNGFTITEERKNAMSFTDAYLMNEQVLVVRKNSEIKSLADAAGKVIGTQAGSSGEEAINDNSDFASSVKSIVKYDDYLTALTDLEVGGVDGIVMDSIVADYQITTGKLPLVVIEEPLALEGYGIGFRKGDEGAALRDKVWATLKEIAADGTLESIDVKWFGKKTSSIQ